MGITKEINRIYGSIGSTRNILKIGDGVNSFGDIDADPTNPIINQPTMTGDDGTYSDLGPALQQALSVIGTEGIILLLNGKYWLENVGNVLDKSVSIIGESLNSKIAIINANNGFKILSPNVTINNIQFYSHLDYCISMGQIASSIMNTAVYYTFDPGDPVISVGSIYPWTRTVQDFSGNGNTGIMFGTNPPTMLNNSSILAAPLGPYGADGILNFSDGDTAFGASSTNSGVQIDAPLNTFRTQGYGTISLWHKNPASPPATSYLFGNGSGTGNKTVWVFLSNNNEDITLNIRDGSGAANLSWTGDFSSLGLTLDSEWNHFCFTMNNKVGTWYVNGQPVTTTGSGGGAQPTSWDMTGVDTVESYALGNISITSTGALAYSSFDDFAISPDAIASFQAELLASVTYSINVKNNLFLGAKDIFGEAKFSIINNNISKTLESNL